MQLVSPNEHAIWQWPFMQDWPSGQVLLQYPQWLELYLTSTHRLSHFIRSAAQTTGFVV
jgi:hypothetical protein